MYTINDITKFVKVEGLATMKMLWLVCTLINDLFKIRVQKQPSL